MAFETVTGYCWPQSVAPGEPVSLHLSSAGGRPVQVEVARVGGTREVRWADTVPAGFHPTPTDADANGCGWPAAVSIDVGDDWRSGYHEVLLSIDVDGRRRISHAFFVVRPAPASTNTILLQLATNTVHAYNDFGGRNLYTGGTTVSLQRPMSPGFLHKPPGPGRRVTNQVADDRQMTAHVGYLRLNHLSPWAGSAGWPDWERMARVTSFRSARPLFSSVIVSQMCMPTSTSPGKIPWLAAGLFGRTSVTLSPPRYRV